MGVLGLPRVRSALSDLMDSGAATHFMQTVENILDPGVPVKGPKIVSVAFRLILEKLRASQAASPDGVQRS